MVMDGKTFLELVEEDAGYVMLHGQAIEDFRLRVETARVNRQELMVCPRSFEVMYENTAEAYMDPSPRLALEAWLNANITDASRSTRAIRQKQLWIYGPTCTGKNRMIALLEKYLKVYWVNNCSDWWDDISDLYDVLVFDEYSGQNQITLLNQILAGTPCKLKRRRRADFVKRSQVPVIIMSNMHPEGCWKRTERNSTRLDALLDRLEIVHMTEPFLVKGIYVEESQYSDLTASQRAMLVESDDVEVELGLEDPSVIR